MKFEAEIIKDIVDSRGHTKTSIHYQSECVEEWVKEVEGAYPKLCDYQPEWLNYHAENKIGVFPYTTLTNVTNATVENVVPYAYKSAILKGSTKYRDIDTGEVLDAFEDGRNLELVSVEIPVLNTTGKNLFDGKIKRGVPDSDSGWEEYIHSENFIRVNSIDFILSINLEYITGSEFVRIYCYDENKNFISTKAITEEKPLNTKYIKFSAQTKNNPSNLLLPYNIQIEYGTAPTTYETYKSNILTCNEEVTLRGIGDVHDTLDCLTGEVVRRIECRLLENRYDIVKTDLTNTYKFEIVDILQDCDDTSIKRYSILNGFKYEYSADDTEHFYIVKNNLIVFVNKSNIPNGSIVEFKEFFYTNSRFIVYPLAQESVKSVELSVVDQDGKALAQIKPIEGIMHLNTTGETIKPLFSGEIPVEAITQNLASFIEE